MDSTTRVTVSSDQKPELVSLLRHLPAILSGQVSDEYGIGAGFKARLGYALLSLILPNFNNLGRGQTGADGDKWAPLDPAYLAYGRRFGPGEKAELRRGAELGRAHTRGPGSTKGLLTPEQLKLWRKTYSMHLARLWMHLGEDKAKSAAAGIAWNTVKKAGARTKLDVFGRRTVQILVDKGLLRGSLTPGTLVENGLGASYQKPSTNGGNNQIFETKETGKLIVGSNDKKASYHHNGKGRRKRRLWPDKFPSDWWRQILGAAVSGLAQIGNAFRPGGV